MVKEKEAGEYWEQVGSLNRWRSIEKLCRYNPDKCLTEDLNLL